MQKGAFFRRRNASLGQFKKDKGVTQCRRACHDKGGAGVVVNQSIYCYYATVFTSYLKATVKKKVTYQIKHKSYVCAYNVTIL